MTAPQRDSACSGIMSLQSMQIVELLEELKGIEMQAADINW
jgi:hypothetical protein